MATTKKIKLNRTQYMKLLAVRDTRVTEDAGWHSKSDPVLYALRKAGLVTSERENIYHGEREVYSIHVAGIAYLNENTPPALVLTDTSAQLVGYILHQPGGKYVHRPWDSERPGNRLTLERALADGALWQDNARYIRVTDEGRAAYEKSAQGKQRAEQIASAARRADLDERFSALVKDGTIPNEGAVDLIRAKAFWVAVQGDAAYADQIAHEAVKLEVTLATKADVLFDIPTENVIEVRIGLDGKLNQITFQHRIVLRFDSGEGIWYVSRQNLQHGSSADRVGENRDAFEVGTTLLNAVKVADRLNEEKGNA